MYINNEIFKHFSRIIPSAFISTILFMLFITPNSYGSEYDVGGGRNNFPSITNLLASVTLSGGDVVNIYPGIYNETWDVGSNQDGTASAPILIRGVDSAGNPVLSPQETVIFDLTGRNEIDVFGDYVTIQGICIRKAAIGFQSNSAITILRYILFKDNNNSFQSKEGSKDIIIEYCEFDGANKASYSHDIYGLHATKLTIQFCYFRNAPSSTFNVIKSRDYEVHILYNYINMGIAPYAIDLPHQGNTPGVPNQHAYIIGNIIERTITNNGGGFAYVKYNQEEYPRNGNVIIINNTFVDKVNIIGAAFSMKLEPGYEWEVDNNIFLGIKDLTRDSTHIGALTGNNNIIPLGVSSDGLTNSLYSSTPNLDSTYRPLTGSIAIDSGSNDISIIPAYQYHTSANMVDTRSIINGVIDIGAYEYKTSGPIITIDTISVQ
ncbi:MAG: hypothetical protein V1706_03450 [Pseudomonadota bacterium]